MWSFIGLAAAIHLRLCYALGLFNGGPEPIACRNSTFFRTNGYFKVQCVRDWIFSRAPFEIDTRDLQCATQLSDTIKHSFK